MKILVTGSTGQLGHELINVLSNLANDVLGVSKQTMDLTNHRSIKSIILKYQPDCIIHCGAYTKVDLAESQPELCMAINASATEQIASLCHQIGCSLIYISTDYVFDGLATFPYETNSNTHPLNVYGKSKLLGEQFARQLEKHYIVRTSWIFSHHGNNFVKTMQNLANCQSINVVDDQFGSPTYAPDLATFLATLASSHKHGTYHASNEGFCSWHEFACQIFNYTQNKPNILPVHTANYPTFATRPLSVRLSKNSIIENGFNLLPPWQDALERYFKK